MPVGSSFQPSNLRYLRLVLTVICVVLIAACATGNRGSLMGSPEATDMFKLERPPADHRFYFHGWVGEPDAVIGVHQDYTLESDLWREVDLEQIPLRLLVDRMTRREPTNFRGAVLRDPEGNRMGIWFSDSTGATIKMAGEKRIAFIRPHPRPIERDDDDFRRPFGVGGGIGIQW